ncbi:MAG: hypothetical protein OHK93_000869 [Ramalina farinacea]|uniref:Secreted protein n=1 Tax=Ramalina farinacea TaxID=258253 RepID=A0AA43QR88_9LECA|nr:hypothetical protein [Ramalina farinacea]
MFFDSSHRGRTLLVLAGIILGFLQANALPANAPAITGSEDLGQANATKALDAEPSDPPRGWSIDIGLAPAPREPFQRSDIFLAGIEALHQLSLRPWSSQCPADPTYAFLDPTLKSDVRVQIHKLDSDSKVAGAVWAIWDVMWWYHQNPEVNDEVVFQTTYNGRPSMTGGFLSQERGPRSSNAVAVTKRRLNGRNADDGGSDDAPADMLLPVTNTTLTSSNWTDVVTTPALGADPAFGCRRDPWWGLHLRPEDSYLALAAMLRNIASKSNAARVDLKIPVGPEINPHEGSLTTLVEPSTTKRDWRGRWPITWHALKQMTRYMASYSASARFGRGGTAEAQCYAVDEQGQELSVIELVDAIRQSLLQNGSTSVSTD